MRARLENIYLAGARLSCGLPSTVEVYLADVEDHSQEAAVFRKVTEFEVRPGLDSVQIPLY